MQPVQTWMTSSQDFRCTCVNERDVALERRHNRFPWMWNFVQATKGGPPTRLGYTAHVLNRGAVSFSLIQTCRQHTRIKEMCEGECVLWNTNSKVLRRGGKEGAYQICQLKSNQVFNITEVKYFLYLFQITLFTSSKNLILLIDCSNFIKWCVSLAIFTLDYLECFFLSIMPSYNY